MTEPKDKTHSGRHVIVKCKVCGTVVMQCRCWDNNKEVRLITCPDCEENDDGI
jgi:hypothetical protein